MWFQAVCVFALSMCVTASVVTYPGIDEEIKKLEKEKIKSKTVDGCVVTDPKLVCDEDQDDKKLVPSGTLCFDIREPHNSIICYNQEWKRSIDKEVTVNHRVKKSHTSCYYYRTRRWWSRRLRTYCRTPYHAPSFNYCPGRLDITTPLNSTTAVVTWDTPTATDLEDGQLSVTHSGVQPGSTLSGSATGSVYSAYYKAKDSKGATATCTVKIYVTVKTCPAPSSPKNGTVTCPSGNNYGRKCTFSCSAGFLPSIQTITCLSSGNWSDGGTSECKANECPQQLPSIDNGHYECDKYVYGATCSPVCKPEYSASINYPIACNKFGFWTDPPATICEDANPPTIAGCPSDITVPADVGMTSAIVSWSEPTALDTEDSEPPTVQQMTGITSGSRVEGDVVHTITYRAFDKSGNPSPACSFSVQVEVIRCPVLSAPDNGAYTCNSYTLYGSQCTFKCHKGYQLQGYNQTQCAQTGFWDTSMPICAGVVCYAPENYGYSIANGFYECPSQITYQSSCVARCNTGFRLQQSVTATCVVDSWNSASYSIPNTPICLDNEPPTFVSCDQDIVLTFDAIKGTRSATVYYSEPTATDNHDISPKVTKLKGPNIGDTINADIIRIVEFQAVDDVGNPSSVCVYRLQVEVIECPVYVPPTNGKMMCSEDSIYGSVCTLTCRDGFKDNGIDETECLSDGSWSVMNLQCVETECPAEELTDPMNGYFECTTFTFNSICSAHCVAGFRLQKPSYARCKADRSWEKLTTPDCRVIVEFEENASCDVTICKQEAIYTPYGHFVYILLYGENIAYCQYIVTSHVTISGNDVQRRLYYHVTTKYVGDASPPSFTDCENQLTFTADKGLVSAIVQWIDPIATDNVDAQPDVTQISGPLAGSRIEGSQTVKYQAEDAEGNPSEICEMNIDVEVIQCPSPAWSANAYVTCDLETIYGSICTYTCDQGYEVADTAAVECLLDGTWSYGSHPPTCSRITCNKPTATTNGNFVCLDPLYEYESVCFLECNSGFSVNQTVLAICDENGQWKLTSSKQCRDNTPPTLYNCMQYQTLRTDRGKITTTAEWIAPQATDNVDSSEDVTVVQLGLENASGLSVGIHTVEYTAIDTHGNQAVQTCSITLNVEEVICVDPKYSFGDTNLVYDCESFTWGHNCSLSCSTTGSFILAGPELITCEQTYWSYEGNIEPHCQAEICPKNLNLPLNGGLVYTNDAQPVAVVTCNSEYDLQQDFDGLVLCLDSGLWTDNPLPDCTRLFRPTLNMLAMELYYEGDCNDPIVQETIKDAVIIILKNKFKDSTYKLDCFVDDTCGYSDLIVGCGEPKKRRKRATSNVRAYGVTTKKRKRATSNVRAYGVTTKRRKRAASNVRAYGVTTKKRKRATSNVRVKLNLYKTGNVSSFADFFSYEEELVSLYELLNNVYQTNASDIPGHPFIDNSMTRNEFSTIECTEPGQVREGFSCKSCAKGFFMTEIDGSKKCVGCPIGTYKDTDSATNCTDCPSGKSTYDIGTKSADMCLDLCSVGSYSLSGLMPCTPCQTGYHKDTVGPGSCVPCSFGQTSFATGQERCSNYDVILSGDRVVNIHLTASEINAITTLFWVYKDCGTQLATEFATSVLVINISSVILIGDTSVLNYTSYCNKWTHVAVSVNDAGYSLFINGENVKSAQEPAMPPIPINSDIKLGFNTDGGEIRFSSLAIFPVQLLAADIASFQSSCFAEFVDAILTSDDIIHNYAGIEANSPTCIATDPCQDSPCGSHLCTPTVDGYVCKCSNGYTGLTCSIPPDYCDQNECKNGASCISNESNYTCTCPLGFRGKFCQISPVIGGWGAWYGWEMCSELCDGGVRHRTRVCDNPAPVDNGIPCSGETQQEEDCNTISCLTRFPCSNDPCGNHTCKVTSTGFKCECNLGYTGSLCETVINNCDPNPCDNGGTCNNGIADFECVCPNGFSGDVCAEETPSVSYWSPWSACDVTCGGGTSTRNLVCSTNISCSTTEEKKVCNDQPCSGDNCLSQPCSNGVCVSNSDDYSCICDTGYVGKSCDIPVDFCETNPCVRGQCSNTGTSYSCNCEKGFTGTLCDTDAENGKWGQWISWSSCSVTCGTGVRERSRTCNNPPPGPGGLECDGSATDTVPCNMECYDSCTSNPCGIDHDCVEEGQSFKCHCKHGYSGPNCRAPPEVCDPNPCNNGGSCRRSGNDPLCDCIHGYSGLTCNVDPDESAWDPWSDWTACSATCNGGSRNRNRLCKLGSEENSCIGNGIDVEPCGETNCPSCPDLPKLLNINRQCTKNESEETVECTLSCRLGFYPPFATNTEEAWSVKYICGPFTSFKWNTTAHSVACSASKPLRDFEPYVNMPVSPTIPCPVKDNAIDQLTYKISEVVCKTGPKCSVAVSIPQCTRRKRRETETQIAISISLDLSSYTDDNSSLDIWQVANESLSPLVTTPGTWLTVEVNGITYAVDTTNVTDDAELACDEGFFLQESHAVCAGCAPGSWFDIDIQNCQPCPVGMYQGNSGQFSCESCPDGYTTQFTGSMDGNECTYDETVEDKGLNKVLIIGVSVGGVVMLGIVGIIIYVVKRRPGKVAITLAISGGPIESERLRSRENTCIHSGLRPGTAMSISDIPIEVIEL